MSTRRPRIKAVAALPPRRKNAETIDSAKNKPPKEISDVENANKSPATPKTYSRSDDKPSPGQASISSSPAVNATSVTENLPSPAQTQSPRPVTMFKVTSRSTTDPTHTDSTKTTPKSEKAHQVSVITTTPNFQSKNKNVFASPQAKNVNSPHKRGFMSPFARNPAPKNMDVGEKANSTSINENEPHESSITVESANKTPLVAENRTDVRDDYSVPSVPESVTEETIMDGIVPLQPAKSVPKPIDMLKSEIISDYAEVLFDPIIPLPSPSKVRPKLRPVPRLAPNRRNSVQGSASESEDENRRSLLTGTLTPAPPRQRHDSHQHPPPPRVVDGRNERIRNDSVSSQSGLVHPPPALSPVKEKHLSKARRQEMTKRIWKRRRECRDSVKRDALTMYDLIFYNPTENPLIPDQEEIKAKEENAKEAERAAANAAKAPDSEGDDAAPAAPVPQIKLGPNGELVLDEKSLVIKQSDANRKVDTVVREGTWSGNGRYTRTARTADWTPAETVRFYRALAAIGTDFTLMAPLFPDRTRRCLKLKFKKEERLNGAQVDKALRSATSWDASRLLDEFAEERKRDALQREKDKLQLIANKHAEQKRIQALKAQRIRISKGSRAMEVRQTIHDEEMTADDFVRRALSQRANEAQAKRTRRTISNGSAISNTSSVPPELDPKDTTTEPSPYATLTLLRPGNTQRGISNAPHLATITKTPQKVQNLTPTDPTPSLDVPAVPPNIENGSLVVLRVNNPVDPTKTMLQTYISHGNGKLTPVALPTGLLNSVVGYMKQGTGTPMPGSGSDSPFASPPPPSASSAPPTQGLIISSPNKALIKAQEYRILGI